MEWKTFKLWNSVELSIHSPESVHGFVLGGGIYNSQPRSKYTSAMICLSIVPIFWDFTISVSYKYKENRKGWFDFLKREKVSKELKTFETPFLPNLPTEISEKLKEQELRTRELLHEFTDLNLKRSIDKANDILRLIKNIRTKIDVEHIEVEVLKLESWLPKNSSVKQHDFIEVRKAKNLQTRITKLTKAMYAKHPNMYWGNLHAMSIKVGKNGARTLSRSEYIDILLKVEKFEKENNL